MLIDYADVGSSWGQLETTGSKGPKGELHGRIGNILVTGVAATAPRMRPRALPAVPGTPLLLSALEIVYAISQPDHCHKRDGCCEFSARQCR